VLFVRSRFAKGLDIREAENPCVRRKPRTQYLAEVSGSTGN
jgi:hypothetical protein